MEAGSLRSDKGQFWSPLRRLKIALAD